MANATRLDSTPLASSGTSAWSTARVSGPLDTARSTMATIATVSGQFTCPG
jgi:hypothetical protein